MNVKKAIIPAAGLGTRFLPATKSVPKEMLPVVDTPTLEYVVREATEAGIKDILIITGRQKTAIEDYFDKAYELEDILKKKGDTARLKRIQSIWKNINIHTVRQKEPKGLGHAILCGEAFVGNEPFAVLLGDDIVYNPKKPCLKQLIEVHDQYQASVLGVQTVKDAHVHKYGIIGGEKIAERLYSVKGMVEKPSLKEAPSNAAILGRYVLSPKIFAYLKDTLPGKDNEIQLTDALMALSQKEKMLAYDFEGKRYDVGDKLGFLEATVEFALRDQALSQDFKAYLKELMKTL